MITSHIGNCSHYSYGKLPERVMNYDFDKLWEIHPKEKGTVKLYGKEIETPRYVQSYLKDYTFSGITHKAEQLPKQFQKFMDEIAIPLNPNYNMVHVNWYEDGTNYIGPHSDDEKEMIEDSDILSISLGATRTFRIREKKTKKIIKDLELKDGQYLIMGGEFQKHYTHEIVKINGKKAKETKKRINLTFRCFK